MPSPTSGVGEGDLDVPDPIPEDGDLDSAESTPELEQSSASRGEIEEEEEDAQESTPKVAPSSVSAPRGEIEEEEAQERTPNEPLKGPIVCIFSVSIVNALCSRSTLSQ